MKSKVYFSDLRATPSRNLLQKVQDLLDAVSIDKKIKKNALVAVKLHFGEAGNTAFIRPVFLRHIIDKIKDMGGKPFLTDTNTLYVGTRSNSVDHLKTAIANGFAYSVVGAPLIIADGLRGGDEEVVSVNLKRFEDVYIASEIVRADALVSVAHFKGHELSGFGGTIKNIGMGCGSRKGKLAQHSSVSPKVKRKKCVGCGDCIAYCAQEAIALFEEKARIDPKTCVGCGECIIVCPNQAIQIRWDQTIPIFLENMVEYTAGVLKGKEKKTICLNFITNVSPACDCYGHADAPIVSDIGIVASDDPIAIDQASVDLVNQARGQLGSALGKSHEPGEDKFKDIYPNVDWEIQLDYGERVGLGTRNYKLVTL